MSAMPPIPTEFMRRSELSRSANKRLYAVQQSCTRYSITSSARASSVGGTVRPSILAVSD